MNKDMTQIIGFTIVKGKEEYFYDNILELIKNEGINSKYLYYKSKCLIDFNQWKMLKLSSYQNIKIKTNLIYKVTHLEQVSFNELINVYKLYFDNFNTKLSLKSNNKMDKEKFIKNIHSHNSKPLLVMLDNLCKECHEKSISMDNNLIIKVIKEKEIIYITLMPIKNTNKYHFVNLTKGHICTCEFDNIFEAFEDLEQRKKDKLLISYEII